MEMRAVRWRGCHHRFQTGKVAGVSAGCGCLTFGRAGRSDRATSHPLR